MHNVNSLADPSISCLISVQVSHSEDTEKVQLPFIVPDDLFSSLISSSLSSTKLKFIDTDLVPLPFFSILQKHGPHTVDVRSEVSKN